MITRKDEEDIAHETLYAEATGAPRSFQIGLAKKTMANTGFHLTQSNHTTEFVFPWFKVSNFHFYSIAYYSNTSVYLKQSII